MAWSESLHDDVAEMFDGLETLEASDWRSMHVICAEETPAKVRTCACGRSFEVKTKQLRCSLACRLNVRSEQRIRRIQARARLLVPVEQLAFGL